MRYLIGVGMIILGGVLGAVTGLWPFFVILFVGVFLFASFSSEAHFIDYRIVNTNEVLVRKRYYIVFLPFMIISKILTLGRGMLQIPWKEEYFMVDVELPEEGAQVKISRKEYIALRNEQRKIYATQLLNRAFMEQTYTIEQIGLKKKENRLILAVVFAALSLMMAFDPTGVMLSLLFGAVFLPMVFLWIPDYKDAKILHNAYTRAMAVRVQK